MKKSTVKGKSGRFNQYLNPGKTGKLESKLFTSLIHIVAMSIGLRSILIQAQRLRTFRPSIIIFR